MDNKALGQMTEAGQQALPDIATSSKANAVGYRDNEPNPLDDGDDGPVRATAQAASIQQPQSNPPPTSSQESLEERKLRLEARREALQKKKREEEEAKNKG